MKQVTRKQIKLNSAGQLQEAQQELANHQIICRDSVDQALRRWHLFQIKPTRVISLGNEVNMACIVQFSVNSMASFTGDYTDGLLYSMRRRSTDSVANRANGVCLLAFPFSG